MPIHLNWEKQSHKRYSARVGPLSIEVVRVGIDPHRYWTVGEVFGNSFLGVDRHTPMSLEEAQETAELIAARTLIKVRDAMRIAGA